MNLNVTRYEIHIEPEGETDIAYLEGVLGLRKDGDCTLARRVNAMGLSCIAYICIKRRESGSSD